MKTVLLGYAFAAVFVVFPLLTNRMMMRALPEMRDSQLTGFRRMAESRSTEMLIGTWLVLCLIGGTFLVIRGRPVGWAWFGVAAVYALGLIVARRNRSRVLAELGDRGRVERTDRQRSRAAISYRFVAVGITAYIAMQIVQYAYPHHPPSGATVAEELLATVALVCAGGFVICQVLLRFGRGKVAA